MNNTVFGSVLVAMSLAFLGCQPVVEEEEEFEGDVEEAAFEDGGRDYAPAEPVIVRGGNMYPEGSYVTGIQPFFADPTCDGDMAWGTSITPAGSGKLFYLVVTKNTSPVLVHYPSDQILSAGYGLDQDTGECEMVSPAFVPPGGKWLRWNSTPLADF